MPKIDVRTREKSDRTRCILENEQIDDAKMLRLMRDESPGTGESPEITDSHHVRYRLTSCQNIIEYMKQSV